MEMTSESLQSEWSSYVNDSISIVGVTKKLNTR